MPVLWLSMILASPVVLVDSVSPEGGVPKAVGATLDPLMCNQLEKALKASNVEVKCRADIEAILKLRAMQSAVGSETRCMKDPEACAAQTAKLAHCTHVLVSTVTQEKGRYTMVLNVVNTTGTIFGTHKVQGVDVEALLKAVSKQTPQIVAALKTTK